MAAGKIILPLSSDVEGDVTGHEDLAHTTCVLLWLAAVCTTVGTQSPCWESC